MSRVAKNPIPVPSGVSVSLNQESISIKGPKGELSLRTHPTVRIERDGDVLSIAVVGREAPVGAMAGTTRALVYNMVQGVSQGFEKKLTIIGVGYRAQVQGKKLNLTLGFSHPVAHTIPEGIVIETPSQTEIVVKGVDKQKVGQVAAEIRAYRPPEPYKGKGVRYSDEHVVRKQAKKK
ncbi:MAG: 50S ribosomal protein L6 [Gammaproteobacteria bacterium]|nr:50S ribosomal protein L6 [Gammaproteobacteria bacterium]